MMAGYRERFPILAEDALGSRIVYLDSAASSQKPTTVIDDESRYYQEANANVHRGLHTLAARATEAYETCRSRVATWIGARRSRDVVIMRGATSALNQVAFGLEPGLHAGDEVLLTEMEHHANLVPWIMIARRRGIRLRHIPITDTGELDLDELPNLISARTRVVSLVHTSNVLGTINPVAAVAEAARKVGATVVVDAAQSVGHMPVTLSELGADLLVFSGHKCYGPMGVGFLVGTAAALEGLAPFEGGGEMISEVTLDSATWAEVPFRFEAGTPNVAAAAAFPAAIDLLDEIGLEEVRAHEEHLVGYAMDRLRSIPGLHIVGPDDPRRRGGLVSFTMDGIHPHDLATILDGEGVAVRAGHHCAQPLHRRLGLQSTTRASFGVYSDRSDVEALVHGIESARRFFSGSGGGVS